MSEAPDIPRELEMLGKVAEMELALAQEYFARARGSGEMEESTAYAAEFRKLTRSMRLSLALREKMLRDRAKDEREAAEAPAPPPRPQTREERVRIAIRKEELFDAVARVLWREREGEDLELCLDVLRDRLHLRPLPDDFADVPLDDLVLDWCADFDVRASVAAAWRDLPPIPPDDIEDDEEPEAEAELQSSA